MPRAPLGFVVLVENKPKAPQPFPTLSDCFQPDFFFFWSCPNQAGFGAPRPLPTLPGRCAAPEAARKAQGRAPTRGFALPTSMLSTSREKKKKTTGMVLSTQALQERGSHPHTHLWSPRCHQPGQRDAPLGDTGSPAWHRPGLVTTPGLVGKVSGTGAVRLGAA